MVFVSAFAKAETVRPITILSAQCAMCRAVLESEEDNSTAKGINNGIKYLMIIPYILVGGVFYFVYKSRKKEKEITSEDSFLDS
ncbi:hypothetical protein [uncultured Dokdonia sp.]|uniref:hypothetical protein n=1 Tax=uncultured Dokdonia sp. TaxID=575653 RepID=UPI00262DEDBA|nr:hypothetical protein [uncultured Dokdonia sp.]